MDRFSSPQEGQIPDRFRQVWTGFRKNLPEPVHVYYLTKPGPNLTEGAPPHKPASRARDRAPAKITRVLGKESESGTPMTDHPKPPFISRPPWLGDLKLELLAILTFIRF